MKCGSEKALCLYESGPQIQVSRAAGVLQLLNASLLQNTPESNNDVIRIRMNLLPTEEEMQSFDSGATMEKTVDLTLKSLS